MNTLPLHHYVGPYTLLAVARQSVVHHQVCGWCFEKGIGKLICINKRMVLSTHADCVVSAELESFAELCTCRDPICPGDNPACPVHKHFEYAPEKRCFSCGDFYPMSELKEILDDGDVLYQCDMCNGGEKC